jgi:branched-chain amino acid transport system ATP-binding protein
MNGTTRLEGADLEVRDLRAGYGETLVLDGISLTLKAGRSLAVLGRNGVGKTTLLASLMGMTTARGGSISFGGEAIDAWPVHRRALAGLGYVPQEREIFKSLTVAENLAVSVRPGGWPLAQVYELFPSLKARVDNTGLRLSGGEQQMLAVARALVGGPRLLLLDEPMEGLAPIVVENLFEAFQQIRDGSGLGIVLVEQKAELALAFADDVIVLDRGRIVHQGPSAELRGNEAAQAELLGLSHASA